MKHSFLLLLVSLPGLIATSQSGLKKVYAYAQGIMPGIKQDVQVIEGGEPSKPATEITETRVSYSIYAEQSGPYKVIFKTAWIKGKAYPVKADKMITPVEMKVEEEGSDGKIILAPASQQPVWVLTPGTLFSKQPVVGASLRKLVAKHELVLVYTWKNKVYYYPVKKIKNLPPVIAI
jgi:hypothetical protein